MGGRGGASGFGAIHGTPEQNKMMARMSNRFAVGNRGIGAVNLDGHEVTEAPKFKKNADGSISWEITGERYYPAIKSAVIGVGDTKARTETTVATGIITTGGVLIKQGRTVVKTVQH